MNTLRLENINLHAPYRVMQDPERHNNFYFVSDSGARFDIDFAENLVSPTVGMSVHLSTRSCDSPSLRLLRNSLK